MCNVKSFQFNMIDDRDMKRYEELCRITSETQNPEMLVKSA